MNVLPKKRVHQFTQYLMLYRNLPLSRSFSILRIAFLRGKHTTLQSLDIMHQFASKASSIYRSQKGSASYGSPRLSRLYRFPKISFKALINPRFAWFSAALSLYGWFLFQIANEILGLHRAVIQVSPGNYVGVSISMAMIWSGIVLKNAHASLWAFVGKTLRTFRIWTPQQRTTRNMPTLETISVQFEPLPLFQPRLSPGLKREKPDGQKPPDNRSTLDMKCQVPLTSSLNVPEACLVCKELISCLSKLN